MIRFDCDYLEGTHPAIMDALMKTNMEQTGGYALDPYCEQARNYIKRDCGNENADVHFLVGGTQANTTVIAAALKPYQAVISADSGHINIHESGAIESTGHKVIALPSHDGKINAGELYSYLDSYWKDPSKEHIAQPRMLYISQPTEKGTLYYKEELKKIKEVCDRFNVYIYADGARLGYALAAEENDVSLSDLSSLTDVFYIGGTKVGALFGEAVVIINDELKKDFRYMQKRHGGMFAKGRLLGIQFSEMFRDGLYYKLGENGIKTAKRVEAAFRKAGFPFMCYSPTNQQFPILPDSVIAKLNEEFVSEFWCRTDENHCCMRFCTSWATTEENISALEKAIAEL